MFESQMLFHKIVPNMFEIVVDDFFYPFEIDEFSIAKERDFFRKWCCWAAQLGA